MSSQHFIAVLLGVAVVLVSCSRPAVQRHSDVVEVRLRDRVPTADRNKYGAVRDGMDWKNPYLSVQARGIDVRSNGAAAETSTMSPGDTVKYLERLPASAWPYGLVVVVSENGLRNPGDDVPIKKNLEELLRLLEKAGIKVELWPSA